MPAKYGCTACHAVDHKVIGPAFKDVAAKYQGQDVEAKLVEKVRIGGSGVWGQVPMIPNPQVPDADLHAVVKWISDLEDRPNGRCDSGRSQRLAAVPFS